MEKGDLIEGNKTFSRNYPQVVDTLKILNWDNKSIQRGKVEMRRPDIKRGGNLHKTENRGELKPTCYQ